MKIKNFKRIYVDIVISCLIIAVVATFFAFKSQTISQEQVLNTLSEISSQSVNAVSYTHLICTSVVLFSLALGALWEIGEYLVDDIFGTNNQQYRCV